MLENIESFMGLCISLCKRKSRHFEPKYEIKWNEKFKILISAIFAHALISLVEAWLERSWFFLELWLQYAHVLKKGEKKEWKKDIPPLSQKGGVRLEKASHSNAIPTIT